MTTPREFAEKAADKSWGKAESGKGMMQDAVDAALLAFAKAHAEEFRRLAVEEEQHRLTDLSPLDLPEKDVCWTKAVHAGQAIAFTRAAQMVEDKLK